MLRQFHGCPASGGGIERVFFSAGKHHDSVLSRKKKQDPGKHIEGSNQYQIADV
jgi:hypothetical protein